MVTDRAMLWLFTIIFIVGTFFIIGRTPYFTDSTPPLRLQAATKPLSGDTLEFELRTNLSFPNF